MDYTKTYEQKNIILIISVIGGVLLIISTAIVLTIAATINNQKTEEAYVKDLNSVSSVKNARFELQHPGVPWNNQLVVFVVMDIHDENQVANSLKAIRAVNQRYMKKATSTHIYVVNSDEVRSEQYNNRSLYFKDFYLGDNQDIETFKQAATSVGMETFENSASY